MQINKQPDDVTIRGDTAKLKQGALTTALAAVAAPFAVEKRP
jgi:hypothetical protein